jgi:hypothetical protein
VNREKALKILLVLVGLLFVAGVAVSPSIRCLANNQHSSVRIAAMRVTSHPPAEGATTWPRTRTASGNAPAITSATTRTAKPDLNEWVRAA